MATNGQDQTDQQQTAAPPPTALAPRPGDDALEMGFGSGQAFALLQRAATMLSKSDLLPDRYRENVANCILLLNMANRMKADPIMVAQNLYFVYNQPGWSGKYKIATANQNGGFSKLRYEWKGEPFTPDWGCRAWATDSTKERLNGPWITWKMVKDEGWYTHKGSKWPTIPEKMFMLRAGAWWVDVYAPELAMGLPAKEDLEDITALDLVEMAPGVYGSAPQQEPENGERANTNQADDLTAQLKANRQGTAPAEATKQATEADSKPTREPGEEEPQSNAPNTDDQKRIKLQELFDAITEKENKAFASDTLENAKRGDGELIGKRLPGKVKVEDLDDAIEALRVKCQQLGI